MAAMTSNGLELLVHQADPPSSMAEEGLESHRSSQSSSLIPAIPRLQICPRHLLLPRQCMSLLTSGQVPRSPSVLNVLALLAAKKISLKITPVLPGELPLGPSACPPLRSALRLTHHGSDEFLQASRGRGNIHRVGIVTWFCDFTTKHRARTL